LPSPVDVVSEGTGGMEYGSDIENTLATLWKEFLAIKSRKKCFIFAVGGIPSGNPTISEYIGRLV